MDMPKYSEYPDALAVTKSEVAYDPAESCPMITTFGTIANRSDIPWKDLQMQVRYFDAAGKMIDAQAGEAYRSFVPARGEGVFRLQMRAAHARDAYARHEVTVLYAKYGGSPW